MIGVLAHGFDLSFLLLPRICPGRHFAEASLLIMISTILHTLTIDHAIDEQGRPITPEAKMTYGVIS